MKNLKKKKGISLIVLVITIIVMIILAAAIILSLSNSGIIGKANKAKQSSDAANLKEYVNVLKAEWELNNAELGKTYSSFAEYAREKLKDSSYDLAGIYVADSGEVYTGAAAEFMEKNVPIGATITGYVLSGKTSAGTSDGTIDGKENTLDDSNSSIARVDSTTWNYIGIDDKGYALLLGSAKALWGDEPIPTVKLYGTGGYLYGPKALNDLCAALYSNDIGTARNMNIDDVVKLLGYTGAKGRYYDEHGTEILTDTPKKANEVKLTYSPATPTKSDGSDLENYLLNDFVIGAWSGSCTPICSNASNLVFSETFDESDGNYTNDKYWLASTSCAPYYDSPGPDFSITFNMRFVGYDARGMGVVSSTPLLSFADYEIRLFGVIKTCCYAYF